MTALGAAFIAMPGHKGLLRPPGNRACCCAAKDVPEPHRCWRAAPAAISVQQDMPDFLPDRLEAGHPQHAGHRGAAGGGPVRAASRGWRPSGPHERQLSAARRRRAWPRIPGLEVLARPDLAAQAGVLSFRHRSTWTAEALGEALADRGIAVRAGLHCAPLAHRTAPGRWTPGPCRLSFSHLNTRRGSDAVS